MSLLSDTAFATRSLAEATSQLWRPRLRLGITGLSRAGKTVLTTALVHHLIEQTRLPVLSAAAEGRIARVRLAPQPDSDIPRFAYETNLQAMTGPGRRWPESTRRLSQLRLEIDYESRRGWRGGASTLTVDIVDYPGEWLLDLALLEMDFVQWCREAMRMAQAPRRAPYATGWLHFADRLDPTAPANEALAEEAAGQFRAFLVAARESPEAVVTTPPGRFLMPGDLEGSPALTFAPLPLPTDVGEPASGTMHALMAGRFDAYKRIVARPFFADHFARLDRQIVLVDVLSALDSGPQALADLEAALDRVLMAFSTGRNTWLSSLFAPRIDRVIFAATKADHLHHTQHDRLDALLRHLVDRAMRRGSGSGAQVATVALSAVRATREARVRQGREDLPTIVGVPVAGERVGDEIFDGESEAAIFPGDLPAEAQAIFSGAVSPGSLRFPRFRPPLVVPDAAGRLPPLPHIRLDRVLEFVLGDRLA